VTYTLLPDVTWSDGTPFTAEDVKYTWEWVTDPANGATTFDLYTPITAVEVIDPVTVTFTFEGPQPGWYVPFSGSWWGAVYPKHILDGKGADGYAQFQLNPVGTGPYRVESFAPGDLATYIANEAYRDPNRPYFSKVTLKGGGDAASAARAVLQTGDYDFAWNLQVEPDVLESLEAGGRGSVVAVAGASLEQIYLNFSDPHTEVNGELASLDAPHPFLTDPVVRQAFALAINRELIATTFYGEGESASANVLVGIPAFESPNTSFAFDVDEANRLLDEAGWAKDGDTRAKDGVELKVTYATTINQVRQKTQAVVKQGLEAIGVGVELKQIDASTYFDTSPGNTQGYIQFFDDLGMSTANIDNPFPLKYMNRWYAGKDNANVPQKANNWSGQDLQRYVNPDYDALYDAVEVEVDPTKVAEHFIQMNDILVTENVVIPLVQRAAEKLAVSSRLNVDNIAAGSFETVYWNIANWGVVDGE
jgi:peptide/nickel transport system substrate-binding protein